MNPFSELELLRETIEFLPEAVAIFDGEDRFVHWNRKYAEFYAWGAHLLARGRSFEDFLRDLLALRQSPGAEGREEAWLAERMARHRLPFSSHEHEIADGRWVRVEERRLVSGGSIGIRVDITELKRREFHLAYLAHHDALTALPNRAALHAELGTALRAGPVSLLLVDLDGFKDINDGFGHAAGDEVLREAAQRLLGHAPPDSVVARMGGDEFVVLLRGRADPLAASRDAARLIDALGAPLETRQGTMRFGASIGIAVAPDRTGSADTLLRDADMALYAAKADGRNCARLYTPTLRDPHADRLRFGPEFHRALAQGEFVIHYQPQVRLADGVLVGAEALLRWQHPEHGLLRPGAFLPALLGSRHGSAVGAWALATACAQAARWRGLGYDTFRMAVNASPVAVRTGAIAAEAAEAVAAAGLRPVNLEIEITEDVMLTGTAKAAIRALHAGGIGVACDDYGTGYASLSLLTDVPLTRLKIDRSFVRQMTDTADGTIIGAVLGLAEGFGLDVIAEGVETPDQADRLRALGCAEAQGHLYAPALPADVFETRFLTTSRALKFA